jgi:flagellar hook-basal body protein
MILGVPDAGPVALGNPAVGYVPDAVTSATVYDSLGTAHVIVFYWTQTAATPANPASWNWAAYDTGSNGQLPILVGAGAPVPGVDATPVGNNATAITFNADGSLGNGGEGAGVQYAEINILNTNGANQPAAPGEAISVSLGTDNANPKANNGIGLRDGVTGDFGSGTVDPVTKAYQPKQTAYTASTDGYADGTLTGLSIDSQGGINCSFSNNQIVQMAKIAMARFANPEGLQKAGGTMFVQSANSGLAEVTTAGSQGMGTTTGGALEASNVDLSVELTNMIIAQRGFEANARIVTTSSDMLTTLVQLGR